MHQQDILIDQFPGNEAAGEGGTTMGDDRLAIAGLQRCNVCGQIAAGHSGFAPTFRARLRLSGLGVSRAGPGIFQDRRPWLEKTVLGISFIGGANAPVAVGQ